MARLIDADAAKLTANDYVMFRCQLGGLVDVVEFLNDMPTVDAAPIVRCKDCKHHYWEQEPCHGKSVHYCELSHMRGVEVFKEFFCYYGERKDGDGNR